MSIYSIGLVGKVRLTAVFVVLRYHGSTVSDLDGGLMVPWKRSRTVVPPNITLLCHSLCD